ncbi:unnamed protein product [Ophioblennius macclurei]
MTTEYHDAEDDSSSFWNKGAPPPGPLSRFYRFYWFSRISGWLFPATTFALFFILIVSLGVSNTRIWNQLMSVDKTVSNLSDSVSGSALIVKETVKDVQRLKFSVENNKEQLSSVSEALKQLSTLDSLSRTIDALKCSLERFINNGSVDVGCCPLGWEPFSKSCFMFSRQSLPWHRAKDFCNSNQGHLAILLTDEDWDFVTRHTSGMFYWIGLTDERLGSWEWVNQTPYVMNRRRWKPGQPDAWTRHGLGPGDEDCAHLHSDGLLNDLHCSSPLHFVCQRHSVRS